MALRRRSPRQRQHRDLARLFRNFQPDYPMNTIIQKSYRPVLTLRGKFWLGYTLLLLAILIYLLT